MLLCLYVLVCTYVHVYMYMCVHICVHVLSFFLITQYTTCL